MSEACFLTSRLAPVHFSDLRSFPQIPGLLKRDLQTLMMACAENLRVLVLDGMKLRSLPPDLFHLERLQEFYFADNDLDEIPEQIGMCTELRFIYGPCNNIKTFPNSIALLLDLEEVNVAENRLVEIPVSLIQMKSLTTLHVGFQKGEKKDTLQRPLISGSIRSSENGSGAGHAVLDYCREIYSAGSRVVNRCKLMLVGDGNVGKTSLGHPYPPLSFLASVTVNSIREISKDKKEALAVAKKRVKRGEGLVRVLGMASHLTPSPPKKLVSPQMALRCIPLL